MTDREKLKRVKDKLDSESSKAQYDRDKVPRYDREEAEFFRGKAQAYWDAVMMIEQEFGVL